MVSGNKQHTTTSYMQCCTVLARTESKIKLLLMNIILLSSFVLPFLARVSSLPPRMLAFLACL